jgi:hypothetical protein
MAFAFCVPKATHIHWKCVIFVAFRRQQCVLELPLMLGLYVHRPVLCAFIIIIIIVIVISRHKSTTVLWRMCRTPRDLPVWDLTTSLQCSICDLPTRAMNRINFSDSVATEFVSPYSDAPSSSDRWGIYPMFALNKAAWILTTETTSKWTLLCLQ